MPERHHGYFFQEALKLRIEFPITYTAGYRNCSADIILGVTLNTQEADGDYTYPKSCLCLLSVTDIFPQCRWRYGREVHSDHQIVRQYRVVRITKEGVCNRGCHIAWPHPHQPHTSVQHGRGRKWWNFFPIVWEVPLYTTGRFHSCNHGNDVRHECACQSSAKWKTLKGQFTLK